KKKKLKCLIFNCMHCSANVSPAVQGSVSFSPDPPRSAATAAMVTSTHAHTPHHRHLPPLMTSLLRHAGPHPPSQRASAGTRMHTLLHSHTHRHTHTHTHTHTHIHTHTQTPRHTHTAPNTQHKP